MGNIKARAGVLQAWGGRGRCLSLLSHTHNTSPEPVTRDNHQTQSQTCPGRIRARVGSCDLSPIPPPPLEDHSPPVGCLVTPHRCPHSPPCITVPGNVLSLPPYSVRDPNAPPHYEDLFPPTIILFPNMTPQQKTPYRPNILSTPLDPPPPYDSLFATAMPIDSTEAPLNLWEDPYC